MTYQDEEVRPLDFESYQFAYYEAIYYQQV